MIPQERVNEAAETANDYMTPGNHRAFNDGFDCGVRFAEAELQPKPTTSAEAKQRLFDYFAQEHEINLMSSDFLEIDNYMKPEVHQTSIDFAEWCIVHAWEIDYREQKSHTISEIFAKFDAERNQQQSELTCPECLSNRILEWPDKYQCRKCEHVWERSAK